MSTDSIERVIQQLQLSNEISRLRDRISTWVNHSDAEMRAALEWQFLGKSKYFRSLTTFCCHRAISDEPVSEHLIEATLVLEMFHNVSLIIDDILDRSRYRRGKLTLHCRYGNLPALMTAGYIMADGYHIVNQDPLSVQLFSELMKRLGIAECMQWRLRQQPLGVEDWRMIAGEDTGTMFEIAACLGTRNERLRQFGRLLGTLYHGCDDVGDVRGAEALGGGGDADIRDGILTLPAALAIRDPEVATMFSTPNEENYHKIAQAFKAKLPDAERYLDKIAAEAKEEARLFADNPEPLFALINHTRQLSQQ